MPKDAGDDPSASEMTSHQRKNVEDDHTAAIDEAFGEYRGRLRHAVSQGTNLRRAPELEFQFDDTLRSAERIEELLRQAADRPPVPDVDAGDGEEE